MSEYLLAATTTTSASPRTSIVPGYSRATQWGLGLIGAIGLIASILGGATTWLLVTAPVTVSSAISTGDAEVFLLVVGAALVDIVRTLVGYL
jgi:hypothetical protein